jgi:anti-sigma regulatory factor (Ser/Thr protein kinase)
MSENQTLNFGLQLQPQPRMVSVVRRFVEESFEKMVGDRSAVHRVSLAVHELLENAAKYAVGDRTGLTVQFGGKDGSASIRLTNRTTPEHIERLRACIEDIQAAAEPFVHYQNLMRKTFGVEEESGLGLARIRAEGELKLSLEIHGDTVTIVASS